MSATWCTECEKDGFRSRGGAMAAASSYALKRDTPLRVYYSETCCCYHLSSKISERDFGMAVAS